MKPKIATFGLLSLLGALGLLAPPVARAAPDRPRPTPPAARDHWTRICPGIRHLHHVTDAPVSAHVVQVDLRAPGVSIEVTPWEQRWLKTSQFGRAAGAVVAINGGFWSVFDAKAEGLVVHGGRRWPHVQDDEFYGFFAITRKGRALISPAAKVWSRKRVRRLREAISGLQRILHEGRVTREAYCSDGCRYRQPRTAVGTNADGSRVWLAVVDGRQAHSRGLSLADTARLLHRLGATEAINLDGGGSAAMYLASKMGLVNQPADRREREVLNHVGVFWRPTRAQLAAYRRAQARARAPRAMAMRHLSAPTAPPRAGALAEPPTPTHAGVPSGFERFVQLHWREILSPRNLLVAVPVLLGLTLLGVWALRRRRR